VFFLFFLVWAILYLGASQVRLVILWAFVWVFQKDINLVVEIVF